MLFRSSEAQATQRALAQILEAGPIQVLVNNAGIYDDARHGYGMGHER